MSVRLTFEDGHTETVDVLNSERICITRDNGAEEYYDHTGKLISFSKGSRDEDIDLDKISYSPVFTTRKKKINFPLIILIMITALLLILLIMSNYNKEDSASRKDAAYNAAVEQLINIPGRDDVTVTEYDNDTFTITNSKGIVAYVDVINGEYIARDRGMLIP